MGFPVWFWTCCPAWYQERWTCHHHLGQLDLTFAPHWPALALLERGKERNMCSLRAGYVSLLPCATPWGRPVVPVIDLKPASPFVSPLSSGQQKPSLSMQVLRLLFFLPASRGIQALTGSLSLTPLSAPRILWGGSILKWDSFQVVLPAAPRPGACQVSLTEETAVVSPASHYITVLAVICWCGPCIWLPPRWLSFQLSQFAQLLEDSGHRSVPTEGIRPAAHGEGTWSLV